MCAKWQNKLLSASVIKRDLLPTLSGATAKRGMEAAFSLHATASKTMRMSLGKQRAHTVDRVDLLLREYERYYQFLKIPMLNLVLNENFKRI